jgi:hypothetical protein
MEREYQQAYIHSLRCFPIISVSYDDPTIHKFCCNYPDFTPIFKEIVGKRISLVDINWLIICQKKVNKDMDIRRRAEEFIDEKREKLIELFWNIDLGKIFCITAREITALSFHNTKTINYTKIPKVIEPKLNLQILELLYSQKITIQKTSHSFTSMAYFLMNCFTQPYSYRTKENIFSIISRRVKSKFFLTKLSFIGQQHLSKDFYFRDPEFLWRHLNNNRHLIKKHYINFMPFLQAMSSNRIDIMLFNDFKWFSQIIQTTQATQTTQTISSLEKTGKLLYPELAEFVESVQSILFCKSKDVCFKYSMCFVVYYAQRLLFKNNHSDFDIFINYIFKENREISAVFAYIKRGGIINFIKNFKETEFIIEYAKKFSYIERCLEDFYDGNIDLPITQIFDEERSVMLNSASPLQKIVFYILNN